MKINIDTSAQAHHYVVSLCLVFLSVVSLAVEECHDVGSSLCLFLLSEIHDDVKKFNVYGMSSNRLQDKLRL